MATVKPLKNLAGRSIAIPTTDSIQLASLGIGTSPSATGLAVTGGPVSLSGNAASSLTTSTEALTITSAAAATWSTSAGALTLNGTSGINLQNAGSTLLAGSSGALTIQAAVTLATTGSGNINLPNNASARFNIENAAVTANVTAVNLNLLTGGGDASALHTHSGGGGNGFTVSTAEDVTLASGTTVDTAGNGRVPANATLAGVTYKVLTAITGPTSVKLGVSGDDDRFALAITLTLNGVGTLIDSSGFTRQYGTQTPLRFSAVGGNFTGGSVRVVNHYYVPASL